MGGPQNRPPGSRVRWDDAQPKRSITSRAGPAPATLSNVPRGTFTGHAAVRIFGFPDRLVKNADDIRPTAIVAYYEVSGAIPDRKSG
ncbi:hypothetical protein FB157_13857 [Streptomyces sp. BK340]|nr:hypothetical protein FB157_13857 [Streptomyces sp. BK340]